MRSCLALLVSLAALARADDRVRQALDRLAQEAAAFQQIAPNLIARETLKQRAIKPHKKRLHLNSGDPEAAAPEWQRREIVSEYGYLSLAANPNALREFRKPVRVDGRDLPAAGSVAKLAATLRASNDDAKRRLLEDFEKLGLVGTVTDCGQMILLFTRASLDRYEFQSGGQRMVGADRALIINYEQREGPEGLTIWEGRKQVRQRMRGELWFRESDLLPLRITLVSVRGEKDKAVREEAQTDYEMSRFGTLAPTAVVHREFRAGGLNAENLFTYDDFRKFAP